MLWTMMRMLPLLLLTARVVRVSSQEKAGIKPVDQVVCLHCSPGNALIEYFSVQ